MGAQQALIVWFKKRVYSRSCRPSFFMVPKAGVEPARAYAHTALNRARLPVSPLRHTDLVF